MSLVRSFVWVCISFCMYYGCSLVCSTFVSILFKVWFGLYLCVPELVRSVCLSVAIATVRSLVLVSFVLYFSM